jgi:hypothetical protein
MTWLAGYERVPGNDAGPHTAGRWKLLLHRTQGSTAAGAIGAYQSHGGWPHITASWRERRRIQHVDLAVAARALRNVAGGAETNRARVVQVELVGFSEQAMSADEARWVGAEIVAPIRATIPQIGLHGPRFYGPDEGLVLATTSSPIRMSPQAWLDFDGICGHQHAPENTHWDPGRVPLDVIIAAAGGHDVLDNDDKNWLRKLAADRKAEIVTAVNEAALRTAHMLTTGSENALFAGHVADDLHEWIRDPATITLPRLLAAVRTADVDVDEAEIAHQILATLTPQAIAAAIPGELAKDVANELAARLAG